jgi:nucleoside triphosphate diphosphatase
MAQLREPETGCPWDLKQNYASILPYTIEEVYEVADAIERQDYSDLKDELGDLLFQVVFYAQLASEDGYFELDDVIDAICDKLERRHPHVFKDQTKLTEEQISKNWDHIKALERSQKSPKKQLSLLDDIPQILPELKRADKIQRRVAKHGFDWSEVAQVWEKLEEESLEIKQAVESAETEQIEEEIGDLLFVCVNLARHYQVDADSALRKANNKFIKRFKTIESIAEKPISSYSLQQLEAFWQTAKQAD